MILENSDFFTTLTCVQKLLFSYHKFPKNAIPAGTLLQKFHRLFINWQKFGRHSKNAAQIYKLFKTQAMIITDTMALRQIAYLLYG